MHARISVFGRLAVRVDGIPLSLGGPRQQAVLALLLVAKGSAVSASRLIDDLWGELPPAAARQTLQSYISNLRKLLSGIVRIDGGAVGYSVHSVEPADGAPTTEITLDAVEFEATIYEARRARGADPAQAAAAYRRALAIAGTDLAYAGLEDVAQLAAEAERLESIRLDALEERIDADLGCPPGPDVPNPAELAAELEVLVSRHPLRERLWGHLVVALYRGGRQAEALRALQRARRVLADELGVEPSSELRALEGQVLAQDPALDSPGAAPAPGHDPVEPWGDRCPYKGLASYERDDHSLFKGRDQLVERLVSGVNAAGVVSVVGPSGSGKSSLVHAGLLGQLVAAANGSDGPPQTLVLSPGDRPLVALVEAISPLLDAVPNLLDAVLNSLDSGPNPADGGGHGALEMLRSTPGVLATLARRLAKPAQAGPALVVVVDQLEELFLLAEDQTPSAAADRLCFVDQLVSAASEAGALAVVLVLRADLYERCPEIPALAAALGQGQILVGPMTGDELRSAVREPAIALGYLVEDALVDEIVAEASDEPGALPLVSHALTKTWELREGRTLRLGAYRAAGGLSGALARSADAVLAEFDPSQRHLAQQLFLTLVSARRDGRDQLRRVQASELVGAGNATEAAILERLVRGRLVVRNGSDYQIAHHTLLSAWPTLRRWVDDDREDLVQLDRLHDAAAEWERLDRDPGALYRRGLLTDAAELVARRTAPAAPVAPLIRAFLDAGQQRETASTRRRRNRSVLLGSLTVIALVTAALAGVNTVRAGRAERAARNESQVATSRRLAAQSATALLRNDRELAMLLALEAARTSPTEEAMGSLGEALYSEQRASLVAVGHEAEVRVVAVNPDGGSLVSTGPDRTLRAWDTRDGTQLAIVEELESEQRDLAFRPDGARFVSVGVDGAVRIWESASLRPLAFRLIEPSSLQQAGGPPTSTTSSTAGSGGRSGGGGSGPGGSGGGSGSASATTGATAPTVPTAPEVRRPATLRTVAWSPDGRVLAVGTGDGSVVLLDASALVQIGGWATGDSDVRDVAWSPDGSQLATGGRDGQVRTWTSDGRFSGLHEGHTDSVFALAWRPDGKKLASTGRDRSLRIWDIAGGETRVVLDAHSNEAFALAWSAGGALASGGADRVARQWDPETGTVVAEFRGHTSDIRSIEFGPSGLLVTSSSDATIRLWSPVSARSESVLEGPRNALLDLSWARSAAAVAAIEREGGIFVWNGDDGHLISALPPQLTTSTAVAIRPDGAQIATASANAVESVTLWDVASGERVKTIAAAPASTVRTLAYLDDGNGGATLLVGDDSGTLHEFTADGTPGPTHAGGGSALVALATDPTGSGVAAATANGDVLHWPTERGSKRSGDPQRPAETERGSKRSGDPQRPAETEQGHLSAGAAVVLAAADSGGGQRALAWSPDGAWLAVGGADRTVRIIGIDSATVERELVHGSEVRALAFDSTGSRLVSGGRDRSLQFWDVASGRRIATIRALNGDVRAIETAPASDWFVVASNRGEVRRWPGPSRWLSDGCSKISRNLSAQEWTDYVGDQPYRTTCANLATAPPLARPVRR